MNAPITSISGLKQFADYLITKLAYIPDNLEFTITVTLDQLHEIENEFRELVLGMYQNTKADIPDNTLQFHFAGIKFVIIGRDKSVWYKKAELDFMNSFGKVVPTDIQISSSDVLKYLKQSHSEQILVTFDNMIKYFRQAQKDYSEGKEGITESGVKLMDNFLQQGIIKQNMYDDILPAVENYNTPYTITDITK